MLQLTPPTAELLKAVKAGDTDLAWIFLEQGADPNGTDPESGGNFLHVAAEFEHTGELAKLLIEYGADVNAINPRFGTTPAMYAARDNIPALALLIEEGAALEKKNLWGQTALDWARQAGNTKAVKMIKEVLGQQEQQENEARLTELHDAITTRQKAINSRAKKKIMRPS